MVLGNSPRTDLSESLTWFRVKDAQGEAGQEEPQASTPGSSLCCRGNPDMVQHKGIWNEQKKKKKTDFVLKKSVDGKE